MRGDGLYVLAPRLLYGSLSRRRMIREEILDRLAVEKLVTGRWERVPCSQRRRWICPTRRVRLSPRSRWSVRRMP